MPDGRTLVNNNTAVLLEEPDQLPRVVSRSLKYPNTLFNRCLGITLVIWRVNRRQKSDVDAKWFRCQLASFSDSLTQSFRIRLCKGSEDSESTSVGDGSN